MIVSPNVASDGLVFYRAHFQLYRSGDGGVSWTRVEAAGEQLVQQVLTSPDFGRAAR